MNKIKKFFICSTFVLLPICANSASSLGETSFIDLHRANKRLVNTTLVNIYDKGNSFYNELNFDSIFKDKELKLLGTNYTATLNNEISDSVELVSELGFGYRKLDSKYDNKKIDFNIADVGLKMYLSYNISENTSTRNAINFGILGHDAVMFKNNNKFNFNEINTALFAQYYNRIKFGIFKTENSATVAYNYNFIKNIKDDKGELLLGKHDENYFDALLKTKTGLEFETDLLDFRAFFVASYNARLNKRDNTTISLKNSTDLSCDYKDRLAIGFEGEIVAGVFGIKLNTDYDFIRKDFYYGLNANVKF